MSEPSPSDGVSVTTSIGGPAGSTLRRGVEITQRIPPGAMKGQVVELRVELIVRNRFAAAVAANMLRRAAGELDAIAARPWPKTETQPRPGSVGQRGPGRPRKQSKGRAPGRAPNRSS